MNSLVPFMKIVFASFILSVVVICGRTKAVRSPNELVQVGVKQSSSHLPHSSQNIRNFERSKRTITEHHISGSGSNFVGFNDFNKISIQHCIFMGSEEGDYYHKAISADGKACGAYIFSEPDQNIEIKFNYFDVPCENGGLVAVVDGWELNNEFFPSPHDHQKPMSSRINEFCGQKKIKQVFISSQNVALIQYRMPIRGTSFSFSVRFVKNPTPCNVLFQNTEGIYTVRNYGKRLNCSISTLFPAAVRVAALNIGVTSIRRGFELETGTIHKCQKRGLEDYVQIGGSTGLDNTYLQVVDSICGLDSKAGKHTDFIGCGTTTVRLVSSGAFDNSVTIALRALNEDDITTGYMSVMCQIDGDYEK